MIGHNIKFKNKGRANVGWVHAAEGDETLVVLTAYGTRRVHIDDIEATLDTDRMLVPPDVEPYTAWMWLMYAKHIFYAPQQRDSRLTRMERVVYDRYESFAIHRTRKLGFAFSTRIIKRLKQLEEKFA